jgi:hypothetical protein
VGDLNNVVAEEVVVAVVEHNLKPVDEEDDINT